MRLPGLLTHPHTRHTPDTRATHDARTFCRTLKRKTEKKMGLIDWARGLIERNMQSAAERDAWWTAYVRGVDTARRDM